MIYKKMYITLFHGITDALVALDENDPDSAKELLIYAQHRAEELYIDDGPESETPPPSPLN